ncbi:MAG: sugar phosphate isomerase/epimerase [Microbacteriaceae bacterium]|nr:sugar phosphate isomerase/epimerase [Microbacteriaceae bacterium]
MMTAQTASRSRPAIAAHLWSMNGRSVDEACRFAAVAGYDGLDLVVGEPGEDYPTLERLATDPDECARLGETGRAHRIRYTDLVIGAILAPGIDDSARATQRELVADLAPRLPELGLTGMTVIPGLVGDMPFAEAEALVREQLKGLVNAAAQTGATISIEPHVESVTDSPERTLRMLSDVPGLMLTLDYSHLVWAGFGPDDIEPLHSRTRHMHVRQAGEGVLSAPVNSGAIDFRRVLNGLKATGYRGALTTEYVASPWLNQDAVDPVVENEAMRAELELLVSELWGPR